MAQPFRFSFESTDDLFAVLNDVSGIRSDALYVRLLRQADGVAVGRAAMPLLPSSRRQVLLDAGRSNVTPFISSVVKIIPSQIVMNGSADFEIDVESAERPAGAKPTKPEPHLAPKTVVKPEVPVAPTVE
jgi:hypothetical protein